MGHIHLSRLVPPKALVRVTKSLHENEAKTFLHSVGKATAWLLHVKCIANILQWADLPPDKHQLE